MEGEIQWGSFFVLQVKSPSLLNDCNQTSNTYRACAASQVWRIKKIARIDGEIQLRSFVVLQVMCPLLMTDSNQTYTYSRECAVSDRCRVSEKSLEWKARYS